MIEAQGLVLVKLNIEFSLSFSYTCILAFLVGYMNIAMEQTEEYVNGQFKNKYGADELMERGSFCSSDTRLAKKLTAVDLVAIVGTTIGAGVYILVGTVARQHT
ncbi:unnamed protein product [Brassica napus]|uniref:(rape) hypothetical protein n=1 Tax=Brassica napus TaxID=3708 RepID=A0A816MPB5_BRANA|nr:unnamed protein product [Brassica napus]